MARNDHSGYPLKWFKDQNVVRNAYECAICLEVSKDSVQVRSCGHQFCALCIDDILKGEDPRCPSCRIEISDEMIFEDQGARRLIKQFVVNCCNEGCIWQGCLSSLLQVHQSSCNFLIHGGDNSDQLKVEKLEENHETLVMKVSTLEEKHEEDFKELKLKHEQDITELKLKHEQDIEELKLKLEQSENRLQRLEEKQKEFYEKEKKSALKKSENPWQRPEEKEIELSKEERKTAEVYRNVIAILNKMTPQKFKTLVEQIMEIMALDVDTPERLEGVIDRIFERAIGEPMYSVAYANLCRCLFTIKVADAKGKDVRFRKLLLNRCQKEFERAFQDNQLEGLSEGELKIEKQEMDEFLAKNKRRMFGNIKFIGELYKLKLLTGNIILDCLRKLLYAGDEESLENMCQLIFTIGEDFYSSKLKHRIEEYFDQINRIIIAKKVSLRVMFMLRDVIELRQSYNKWIPRREQHYDPKTIDQIHKEAQIEKMQEQRLTAQLPAKDNKRKKGRRESPKPVSKGGFIITAGKGGNKPHTMTERYTEEISLGPSARFGQWGRGFSAGLNNSSQEQDQPQGNVYSAISGGGSGGRDMPFDRPYDPRRPTSAGSRPLSGGLYVWGIDKNRVKRDENRDSALEAVRAFSKSQKEKLQVTQLPAPSQQKQEVKVSKKPKKPVNMSEDELAKKTTALIDEYANTRDLKETITCFTNLHSPNLHYLFVLTAVEHTYEMSSRARYDTGKLFAELLSQKKLSKEQLTTGFNNVLEVADDNAIDYPMLWKYLAEIITPVILGDLFTLSDLKPQILEHLIPVGKAAVLLAEILLITKELKDESKAVQIWTDLGISWFEVLPERLTKEDFLSRKNINFLPNGSGDELLTLLRADQFKIYSVLAYIEKNFREEQRKEGQFINHLVTAVAESCIINKDKEFGPDCCHDKLKARKDILRKYLDNNNSLELQALFALQEIYVKYNKPAAMLPQFFNTLYDEEVITEEAFMDWKRDENPSRQEGKGPALQSTSSFFEWLRSAAVEGSEN